MKPLGGQKKNEKKLSKDLRAVALATSCRNPMPEFHRKTTLSIFKSFRTSHCIYGMGLESCSFSGSSEIWRPIKVLGPHPATYGLGPEERHLLVGFLLLDTM